MPQMPKAVDLYCSYCRSVKNRSLKTVSEYEHDLLTFFRYIIASAQGDISEENMKQTDVSRITIEDIGKITKEDIFKYMDYLTKVRRNSATTRARKLSSLKGFFRYLLVVRGEIESNPCENMEGPRIKNKLPKFLTLDESIALL
ncbi:MAG: site-specific integrase, partial [Clostridia bacterium]|nr:site-specific integrase [Clostridia bacterium]